MSWLAWGLPLVLGTLVSVSAPFVGVALARRRPGSGPRGTRALLLVLAVVTAGATLSLWADLFLLHALRAHESEARLKLRALWQAYQRDGALAVAPPPAGRYRMSCGGSGALWQCTARGNLDDDPAEDVWQVSQGGRITHLYDDAHERDLRHASWWQRYFGGKHAARLVALVASLAFVALAWRERRQARLASPPA